MSQISSRDLDRWAHTVLLAAMAGSDTPPDWVLRRIERGLGGVCLFARNVPEDADGHGHGPGHRLRHLTDALRAAAPDDARPLVAVDEEGGDVTRLHHRTGSPQLGPLALAMAGDTELTRRTGRAIGTDLAASGIDWTLAPVADVERTTDSPVIGVRSFGGDPDVVSRHVVATVHGLHQAGTLATAKHFPGHGATAADSHTELPRVRLDGATWRRTHLPPFEAAIGAGVDTVMLGHLVIEALDPDLPASLSPAAVRLLREELGFTGTIVTDALEMAALTATWTLPGAAVRALCAGADVLCLSGDLHDEAVVDACVRAILAAVADRTLDVERLAEAAESVAALRRRGLALRAGSDSGRSSETGGSSDAGGGTEAPPGPAEWAASLRVRGEPSLTGARLDVVVYEPHPNIAAGQVPWHPGRALVTGRPGTIHVLDAAAPAPVGVVPGGDLVLIVRDLHRHRAAAEDVARLVTQRPDAVVIEMGLPGPDPGGRAWVRTHGASAASCAAVLQRLGVPPTGPGARR